MRQFLTLDTLNQHKDVPQGVKDVVLSFVRDGEAYLGELVRYYTNNRGSLPVEIRGLNNNPNNNFWLDHYQDYANDGETLVPGWRLWGGLIWHLCEKPATNSKARDRTQTKLSDVWSGNGKDCIFYKCEIRWRASDGRMHQTTFPSLNFGGSTEKPEGKTQTRVWHGLSGGIKPTSITLRDMILLVDQWLEVERVTRRIQRVCHVEF